MPYIIAACAVAAFTDPAAACAAHDAATKHRIACQQQTIEHCKATVDYQHEVAVEMVMYCDVVTAG